MARPQFTIKDFPEGFRQVSFEIPGGQTTPEEFAFAVAQLGNSLSGSLPILLFGRGPIWGYAMLLHAAHATPSVAVYDPRLGYVVTQSHSAKFTMGQIISDPDPRASP